MLITSYVFLNESKSKQEIIELYTNTYKNCPFIRLVQEPSEIRIVAGSNFCDIYIEVKENIVCVTAALDNLVKGMAGQAIQNINLKCGLPESMGLNHSGLGLI
jgi:N-acetyl-gamma-glutamyl-phosphate reductase